MTTCSTPGSVLGTVYVASPGDNLTWVELFRAHEQEEICWAHTYSLSPTPCLHRNLNVFLSISQISGDLPNPCSNGLFPSGLGVGVLSLAFLNWVFNGKLPAVRRKEILSCWLNLPWCVWGLLPLHLMLVWVKWAQIRLGSRLKEAPDLSGLWKFLPVILRLR
jgi:hypothetical protein